MPNYSKEEIEKFLAKLPVELKDALYSEKTHLTLVKIARDNGIEDAFLDLFKYTGHVLIGALKPDLFPSILEKELGLGKKTSQRVAQDIFHLIFLPVKESLEELYGTELKLPVISPETPPEVTLAPETPTEISPPEILPKEKPQRDIYREPIE